MAEEIRSFYREYREGRLTRRGFLKKLSLVTGSAAAAAALLPVIESNELMAAKEAGKNQALVTEFVNYPAATGNMRAFMARPKKGKKFPAVIVIHENRGLVPHIRDVTRRMADEGFLALAPDALSPVGGTPDDTSNVRELFGKLNNDETTKNFVAAVKYLKTHPKSNGKVGCTGFCWGGAMTNNVAVNSPDLNAAVPYYGRTPAPEDVEKIKAPVMAHFAGNDPGINAGIPAFEEALKKYNKEYQIFMYEGASHAFNNDSNPERYNEQAAKLAWERTVNFFREKLK
ncbi:MAG TPA: dienelactone hydrolase family protein [Bacteroidales bacterium]|jgi:carboxymethylenebutenolidase|nr:twin-arginine translocation signal domain-containing protein [Bacteroidales bacterium]HNY53518.1 dienelactone hydrolase family protein [Bacteroidales bacterium]HOG57341.1 dienelactone hydrolase family protein [Bacteroidales bacterium]HPV16840.1 dienelactone hydrolase family protein [Bacteroidales bacterium]HPX44299.1 dienelactone hydrolase family protein [Bacteroidales bacterium]